MRIIKLAAAILSLAVFILAWQRDLFAEQQQQTVTPQRGAADKAAQESFNLQAQCSEIARKFLSSRGWKIGTGDDYKNHYNSKINKCFILVSQYSLKSDFLAMDLYDAVEGRRYATFNGHQMCDVFITKDPKKCQMDSGQIWFDGNDSRTPADFNVGFRGLLYGGGTGDENTLKTFLNKIQPFMTQ
jgi:hypothetical protein